MSGPMAGCTDQLAVAGCAVRAGAGRQESVQRLKQVTSLDLRVAGREVNRIPHATGQSGWGAADSVLTLMAGNARGGLRITPEMLPNSTTS
jgi:hypothetical protein